MQTSLKSTTKRAVLFLALIALALWWLPKEAISVPAAPQALYERAWELIRDNYYDTTFNHQNWFAWRHKYDGALKSESQAYDAIRAMLKSLDDPYTRFLDPKSFNDENDAINSFVCGVGISLRPYDQAHALIVNDVIEGGPASQAGLKYGDEIVAIDGQPTTGVDGEKAAQKIRGTAGTTVELTVKRGNETRKCTLTRAEVCIPAVTCKRLGGDIGYIRITTFMADGAASEFRKALTELSDTRGLVIDLRDNPGGLLTNAIDIADMLMDHGKIVTTESRHGRVTDGCSGMAICNEPIVLLCDHDSASASEILAGALKDNRRAIIVGSRTYGKGLVQEITRLPNGSGMHVTVARYYTPNGSDINKVGIAPDVEVEDRDQQLAQGVSLLRQQTAHQPNRGEQMSTAVRRDTWLSRILGPRSQPTEVETEQPPIRRYE